MTTAVANSSETMADRLVEKLTSLQKSLSAQETKVFQTIIESAAEHARMLQSNDACSKEVAEAKPKSVPQTSAEKSILINLPSQLFN